MKKMTRMESNKEARRVLNRNGVNLSHCQCSCFGKEIRLTGNLLKQDDSDFNGGMVESLIQDFQSALPGYVISGDLDNWKFSSDHITFLGNKDENGAANGEEENIVYVLDIDDQDLGTG